jgi:class 3 adenylate cyclase/ActR/RegA family two-component response regulator
MDPTPPTPAAGPKTVLVVDDSNIMRRLVSEIVGMDPDFKVLDTAENGKIALQKVRLLKPDVILLDIEMPELSGLETLRRLGLRSPSKVVILSSLGGEGTPERAEALRLGAAEVLDKPSGSVSMDIKSSRGSAVMRALRRVTGLPLDDEASPSEADDDGPEPALATQSPLQTAALSVMLNSVKTAMLAFDAQGTLSFANKSAIKLLERKELEAGKITLDELFGDYNSMFADDIRSVIDSGISKDAFTVDYSTDSGEWLPFLASVTPAPPHLKEFASVLVTIEDTSAEQNLRKVLDKVMSSAVTDAVVGGEDLALGGKLAEATVLFSDVRSFTKLCEGLGAEAVVHMMNEYFAFMADVIRGNYGVIDKYIGDAIMALFGVPKSTGQDAQNAVQAGFSMLQALDLLNGDREKEGRTPFKIGIGLATGHVVAGLLGSPERMNYTVMGNSVNLSARIESLTSHYGAQLLVCSETYRALKTSYRSRLIDKIRVKGQTQPAALYEILYAHSPEKEEEWLCAYASGLGAYETGNFKDAIAFLEKSLLFNPLDKASNILLSRCAILLERPQPDWDGVWSMESKSG